MSGEASEKKIVAEEIRSILVIADRLYKRDPARFKKIIVWVNWASKDGWPNEMMLEALQILEGKELSGAPVELWWPYLYRVMQKHRTQRLQREGEGYKKGDLNSIRSILSDVFRRADDLQVVKEADDA